MKRVYTCFCTDVIHEGHMNILREARKYGDVTVGVLSDAAMIRFNRFPTISFEERVQRAGDPNDYLRVILTDDEELYDPQAALRAVYPNLMRLDFDNIRTQTADAEGLQREEAAQQLTPVQLFEQFFAEQNGKQMTDWQKQQLARIGREMEDSDEADSCNG